MPRVVTRGELVGATAMPRRGEEDHDRQPAPLDVGVEMAEEGPFLACRNERVESTVASSAS